MLEPQACATRDSHLGDCAGGRWNLLRSIHADPMASCQLAPLLEKRPQSGIAHSILNISANHHTPNSRPRPTVHRIKVWQSIKTAQKWSQLEALEKWSQLGSICEVYHLQLEDVFLGIRSQVYKKAILIHYFRLGT